MSVSNIKSRLHVGASDERENDDSERSSGENLTFLKEMFEVVDWIQRGKGSMPPQEDSALPPVANKLEEQLMAAKTRVVELEAQLRDTNEENISLKEKLNDTGHLVGHLEFQMIRLNRELEVQKWERFDAVTRLQKMVKDVAELQSTIGELVSNLKKDDPPLPQVIVKKEITEEDVERIDRQDVEQTEKSQNVSSGGLEVLNGLKEKLHAYMVAQQEAKANILGIQKKLQQFSEFILRSQFKSSTTTPGPSKGVSKETQPHVEISAKTTPVLPPTSSFSSVETQTSLSTLTPVKSILTKRPVDNSSSSLKRLDECQEDPPSFTAKRQKRVHFCIDSPTVQIDHKENHRQTNSSTQDEQLGQANVPSGVDQQLSSPVTPVQTPDEVSRKHFEIKMTLRGNSTNPIYHCNCGSSFRERRLLNRHLTTNHTGIIYVCPIPTCPKKFVNYDSIIKHAQKSHQSEFNSGVFDCRKSLEAFASFQNLQNNKKTSPQQPKEKL